MTLAKVRIGTGRIMSNQQAVGGYITVEIKSRIASGEKMTRGEAFDKAWRLGIKGDFSLYDEIVHADYESINQGVSINRDVSKAVLAGIGKMGIFSPCRVICENDDFVCLHRFSRVDEVFFSLMIAVNYEDGKVITQETIREPLDEDPSEGQDWNWEDYG